MMSFDDGYHAGLTNDRDNPHVPFTLTWSIWQLGNDIGVRVHCAVVEAVYVNSTQNEDKDR